MKKLTSTILAAVTAVLLACAFSACGNPNGGNSNPEDSYTVSVDDIEGTYSGTLTSDHRFNCWILFNSPAYSATFTDGDNVFNGPVTFTGHNFSIDGGRTEGTSIVQLTLTGSISEDFTTFSNIKFSGTACTGTMEQELEPIPNIEGNTYSGVLTSTEDFDFTLTIQAGRRATFSSGSAPQNNYSGVIIYYGNTFSILGINSLGWDLKLTGTVSSDGRTITNICRGGAYTGGSLTLEQ